MGNCCGTDEGGGKAQPQKPRQSPGRKAGGSGADATDDGSSPRSRGARSRAGLQLEAIQCAAEDDDPKTPPPPYRPPPSEGGCDEVVAAMGDDCSLEKSVSCLSPGRAGKHAGAFQPDRAGDGCHNISGPLSPLTDLGTPTYDLSELPEPFPLTLIRFESPSVRLVPVTTGWQREIGEKYKIKLHTSIRSSRAEVDRYYIHPACVLSTFAHVRCPRMVPSSTPVVVSCDVDFDLIIALHADNPTCLDSSFQRVITNASFSRFLALGPKGCAQKWYRLYHRPLPAGEHRFAFRPDKSFRHTAMNQMTMFVRPVAREPSLHVTPIDDDSPD